MQVCPAATHKQPTVKEARQWNFLTFIHIWVLTTSSVVYYSDRCPAGGQWLLIAATAHMAAD